MYFSSHTDHLLLLVNNVLQKKRMTVKKKIVIGMSLCNDKCRSRALKIAVSAPGVESAAVVRGERDEVVVIGDCVDSVELTRRLRKKMGHAELLSVGEANAKADQPPPHPPAEPPVAPPCYVVPYYHHYQVSEPTCHSPCSIL